MTYTKTELYLAMVAGAILILVIQLISIYLLRWFFRWMEKSQDKC
jgi:hypothetical protein